MGQDDPGLVFEEQRERLVHLAYRMVGTVSDAEDIVQDAFVRYARCDQQAIAVPAAYLTRIVTRLCLDWLKSARVRREVYPGPWLPEPMVEPDEALDEDVTLPLMMALERLSPLERAAFLLHDLFGVAFEEIATIIGRGEASCRQLASRARQHVREARPRFPVQAQEARAIAEAFYRASREGDLTALQALLSQDVVAIADGGGRVPASARPVVGIAAVLERHGEMAADFSQSPSRLLRFCWINGLAGFMTVEKGDVLQTTAFVIEERLIRTIYVVRNPEKLKHLVFHIDTPDRP